MVKGRDKEEKLIIEISKDRLEELLKRADLKVGENVRIVKGLEISAGSIFAKQYDR